MATVTPFPSTPAAGWARTVHTVAAKARATFPSLGGKIDHATALVLSGAVARTDTPHAYTVASETDTFTFYAVVCGMPPHCECEDFTRHGQEPDFRCKHLLATWIYRRAQQQQEPAPAASAAPCPEALFSLTLKGTMGGAEALLTARGATWDEFRANVALLSGLLDAPPMAPAQPPTAPSAQPPAASAAPAEGWCPIHQVAMKRQSNERGSWWSHPDGDGWCRGKKKRGA